MSSQIYCVESMPFAENTYILWHSGSPECVVFDPGMEPELIFDALQDKKLQPVAIINTHGHSDHIAGNAAMKARFPDIPLIIGEIEAPFLSDPNLNLSRKYGYDLISPPADQLVNEGDTILFAGFTFHILHIPGHSPGSLVFWAENEKILIVGDVLFSGSIGRTDFPGGSFATLAAGIQQKIYTLPDDTKIYPGHGPVTTVGQEKRTNPYVRAAN
ncbi:MAG: MBL fold metallo-hydrolase [Zavarzinella sp.]